MDYIPAIIFAGPHNRYWPIIDDALRAKVYREEVVVRVLVSKWNHTERYMQQHLESLLAINGAIKGAIECKWFQVPVGRYASIPYARVNHNKYMVTERSGYVGTSNWSGDYFVSTGGISMVVNETDVGNMVVPSAADQTLRKQLERVFLRDWNSKYATDLYV